VKLRGREKKNAEKGEKCYDCNYHCSYLV